MINLVRNELTKILHKKGVYIVLIVFLALNLLILGIDKYTESMVYESGGAYTYTENIKDDLDPSSREAMAQKVNSKTDNEITQLVKENGGYSSWQGRIILDRLWQLKADINLYENGLDEFAVHTGFSKEEAKNKYDDILGRVQRGDWRSFVTESLEDTKSQIADIESRLKDEELKDSVDTAQIKELNKNLEILKLHKQSDEWRLEKNIEYKDEGYEEAFSHYTGYGELVIERNYRYGMDENTYKDKAESEFNYYEKADYQRMLEEFNIAKYRIENQKPDLKSDSISGSLENLFAEVGLLFIIIISIMITGTIISEEFNKGTIKLLLVRPYTRRKIMLSKIIASIICIILAMLCMILIQTFVSGIGYGFDTINAPVLKYNFKTNSVMEINIFVWLAINILAISPIIIILSAIALAIGTLLTNSASAITLSLLTYMGASILKQLAMVNTKIKWLKYIPFVNWDFTEILFGKLSSVQGVTMQNAIISCIILVAVLLIITFEGFARRNIKNI